MVLTMNMALSYWPRTSNGVPKVVVEFRLTKRIFLAMTGVHSPPFNKAMSPRGSARERKGTN